MKIIKTVLAVDINYIMQILDMKMLSQMQEPARSQALMIIKRVKSAPEVVKE